MNSNSLKNLLLGILLFITMVLLCMYIKHTQVKMKNVLFTMQKENNNCQFELFDKKEANYYSLASEMHPVPEMLNFLSNKNVCVLRIHDGTCLGCYAENLIRFSKLMNEKNIDFFVLGSYSTNRQFYSEIFNILKVDSLNSINSRGLVCLPADSLNRPYLFIKDKGIAHHVYVFEKGEYNNINQYINMLERLYTIQK